MKEGSYGREEEGGRRYYCSVPLTSFIVAIVKKLRASRLLLQARQSGFARPVSFSSHYFRYLRNSNVSRS